jgi:hypothetical protein
VAGYARQLGTIGVLGLRVYAFFLGTSTTLTSPEGRGIGVRSILPVISTCFTLTGEGGIHLRCSTLGRLPILDRLDKPRGRHTRRFRYGLSASIGLYRMFRP